jgi:hemoglobin
LKELADQLCEATGGPCTYTGRSMAETHAGMQTTAGEFDVVMRHLDAALDELNVPRGGAGRAGRSAHADAR